MDAPEQSPRELCATQAHLQSPSSHGSGICTQVPGARTWTSCLVGLRVSNLERSQAVLCHHAAHIVRGCLCRHIFGLAPRSGGRGLHEKCVRDGVRRRHPPTHTPAQPCACSQHGACHGACARGLDFCQMARSGILLSFTLHSSCNQQGGASFQGQRAIRTAFARSSTGWWPSSL